MNMEKVYKTMKSVGVGNLIFGILIAISGCLVSSVLIVNGIRLLKKKKDLLF